MAGTRCFVHVQCMCSTDDWDKHAAPVTFLLCATLHLCVWLLWCTGWVQLQHSSWSFNLMSISLLWAAFSTQEVQTQQQVNRCFSLTWSEIEKFALRFWFPPFVSLAKGYSDHIGLDARTQVFYFVATFLMTMHAKEIPLSMFQEWCSNAQPARLAHSFRIWRAMFVLACIQAGYSWHTQDEKPAQYGTSAAFRDIHWLIVSGLTVYLGALFWRLCRRYNILAIILDNWFLGNRL